MIYRVVVYHARGGGYSGCEGIGAGGYDIMRKFRLDSGSGYSIVTLTFSLIKKPLMASHTPKTILHHTQLINTLYHQRINTHDIQNEFCCGKIEG